ncbi:unnamed protein product [Amoebophrya sp. A120]|nr:unnamed protein product [Amoebophrya sp. A120]|eukprot:GSA120T00017198001.1
MGEGVGSTVAMQSHQYPRQHLIPESSRRSDGQRFRERLGFVLLVVIGFYFLVRILVEFKPVLEPFLWAVVFVSAIDPLVTLVEEGILSTLLFLSTLRQRCCSFFCFRIFPRKINKKFDLEADDVVETPLQRKRGGKSSRATVFQHDKNAYQEHQQQQYFHHRTRGQEQPNLGGFQEVNQFSAAASSAYTARHAENERTAAVDISMENFAATREEDGAASGSCRFDVEPRDDKNINKAPPSTFLDPLDSCSSTACSTMATAPGEDGDSRTVGVSDGFVDEVCFLSSPPVLSPVYGDEKHNEDGRSAAVLGVCGNGTQEHRPQSVGISIMTAGVVAPAPFAPPGMSQSTFIAQPSSTQELPSSFLSCSSEWSRPSVVAAGTASHARRGAGKFTTKSSSRMMNSATNPWMRSIAKYGSIVIVLGCILTLSVLFFFFVLQSARRMKDHWQVYEVGANNLRRAITDLQQAVRSFFVNNANNFIGSTASSFGNTAALLQLQGGSSTTRGTGATAVAQQEQAQGQGTTPFTRMLFSSGLFTYNYDSVAHELLTTVQDIVYSLLGSLLNNVSSWMFSCGMTILYALFWLTGRRAAQEEVGVDVEGGQEKHLHDLRRRGQLDDHMMDHQAVYYDDSVADRAEQVQDQQLFYPEVAFADLEEEGQSLLGEQCHDSAGFNNNYAQTGVHPKRTSRIMRVDNHNQQHGLIAPRPPSLVNTATTPISCKTTSTKHNYPTAATPTSDHQQHHLVHQLRGTFRRYLLLKSISCLGFGCGVAFWLNTLNIDLAAVFGAITFVMNYVPEVGPFISMVLPIPVILLDSRLERPFFTLFLALIGQIALKFAFANIIEVKLIESDKKLKMHPVILLLSVAVWGHVWGPTGMLLSVPLMAFLKISVLSEVVPASYRDPVLVLLEGDANAPRRHLQLEQR